MASSEQPVRKDTPLTRVYLPAATGVIGCLFLGGSAVLGYRVFLQRAAKQLQKDQHEAAEKAGLPVDKAARPAPIKIDPQAAAVARRALFRASGIAMGICGAIAAFVGYTLYSQGMFEKNELAARAAAAGDDEETRKFLTLLRSWIRDADAPPQKPKRHVVALQQEAVGEAAGASASPVAAAAAGGVRAVGGAGVGAAAREGAGDEADEEAAKEEEMLSLMLGSSASGAYTSGHHHHQHGHRQAQAGTPAPAAATVSTTSTTRNGGSNGNGGASAADGDADVMAWLEAEASADRTAAPPQPARRGGSSTGSTSRPQMQ